MAKTLDDLIPLEKYINPMPPRIWPPQTVTSYSNLAVCLAGYLVEVVSGMKYADYLQKNIFDKLNMTSSTVDEYKVDWDNVIMVSTMELLHFTRLAVHLQHILIILSGIHQ